MPRILFRERQAEEMMDKAEEHIRRAMEAGQFENLPGKGKPLRLVENPFEAPEWRLAYHVLRSNGFSLPWMETRSEIESAIREARQFLQRAWLRRNEGGENDWAEREWERALQEFRERVAAINQQIFNYNLQTPSAQLQMCQLRVERELELTLSPPSDKLAN